MPANPGTGPSVYEESETTCHMTDTNNINSLDLDLFRSRLLPYTRRALDLLPKLTDPWILDIGCGTGVPTVEIARLTGGEVLAIDIDRISLGKLLLRAREAGLASKISVKQSAIQDLKLPPESFDLIWSEGVVAQIGFESALTEWRDLLVSRGFLVVHDELTDVDQKVAMVTKCGYTLVGRFEVVPEVWWDEYYAPIKSEIERLERRDDLFADTLAEIESAKNELDMFDVHNPKFGSMFFVLRSTK